MRQSRREALKVMGAAAASCLAPAVRPRCAHAESSKQPNVIVIMADDLGYGDLGCYGNREIRTPHLDGLAARGMRWLDFHSNAPVCSPTRAALMTGRYQQRCGIEGVVTAKGHRDTGMPLPELTFGEVLRATGYATALFGKWHLGYEAAFGPIHQGFDVFRGYVSGNVDYHSHVDQQGFEDWWNGSRLSPEAGYTTDLISGHGVRFIEAHPDRPFCLYLAYEAPHYPYQGRKDKAIRASGRAAGSGVRGEASAAVYREMVEAMDEGVGSIVAALRRAGIEENTFLFFCSDNGAPAAGCNAPLRGAKGSLWEGGHRVPAIACWPGRIPAGTVTQETAMTMDVFPTLAALAGAVLPARQTLDGVSLVPVLTEQGRLRERSLFWRYNEARAVRRGEWKLLLRQGKRGGDSNAASTRLYHLGNDVGETQNLAEREPETVAALQRELAAWEQAVSAGVERRT